MKHLETFNHWYDGILNSKPFLLDDKIVKTIGIAWIFKENGKWIFKPKIVPRDWQYANAQLFLRVGLPFSIFAGARLSKTSLIQAGIGWKQTGRFAIHLRKQTDTSAAAGFHPGLPNTGQAAGWEYGKH